MYMVDVGLRGLWLLLGTRRREEDYTRRKASNNHQRTQRDPTLLPSDTTSNETNQPTNQPTATTKLPTIQPHHIFFTTSLQLETNYQHTHPTTTFQRMYPTTITTTCHHTHTIIQRFPSNDYLRRQTFTIDINNLKATLQADDPYRGHYPTDCS